MGCVGILETAFRRGLVPDLRQSYQEMLAQGIRIDRQLLNHSLASCGLPSLCVSKEGFNTARLVPLRLHADRRKRS